MTVRGVIRVWQLAELVVFFGIYYLLEASFLRSLLCSVVTYLLIRLLLIGTVCLWVNFSNRANRLGALGFIRYWLGEFYAFTILYAWYQLKPHAGNRQTGPVHKSHVILAHGFLCNNGFWFRLESELSSQGISYSYVEFVRPFSQIEEYASLIGEEVRRIKSISPDSKINIVAFSMGGLAARHYLSKTSVDNVRLITVNTPHQGTWLAWPAYRLTGAANAQQMLPKSLWLKALLANEKTSTVDAVIRSLHDTIVIPPSLGYMDRPAIELPGRGHMTAAVDRSTHEAICNLIKSS